MNELGLFFVGIGLLFALHPSTAAWYPASNPDGQRLVRYIAAPILAVLWILIFRGITIQ